MANVAKYDRDKVINIAMLLFWEKGFHATSTRDLQQATDMRPGSFYAAFGSKDTLYKYALERYTDNSIKLLHEKLASQETVLSGIKAFIDAIVIERSFNAPNEQCMLFKTINELSEQQAELLAQGRMLLNRMESAILAQLEIAYANGEFDNSQNCELLARRIIIQIMGLRTYMRNCENPNILRQMIDDFFNSIVSIH